MAKSEAVMSLKFRIGYSDKRDGLIKRKIVRFTIVFRVADRTVRD